MKKYIFILFGGAIALISLPLSMLISQSYTGSYGISVSHRYITDFEWADYQGNLHNFSDWNNKATFLFVGYLNCKLICHKRIQEMLSIKKQLNANNINFLFVTIDPKNDTPEVRKLLIDSRADNFYSANLKNTDLNFLQGSLQENVISDNDEISHRGNIYLITGGKKIEKIYTQKNLNTELVIKDIPEKYFMGDDMKITQI
ncbi:MAG: SCO family protein [Cellvibrionaceae bacterium]